MMMKPSACLRMRGANLVTARPSATLALRSRHVQARAAQVKQGEPVLFTAEQLAKSFVEEAIVQEPLETSAPANEALAAAIAVAKECTDDCGISWDEVEELSAAAADDRQKAQAKTKGKAPVVTLKQQDLDRMVAVATSLKAAQKAADPGNSIDMFKAVELAVSAAKTISKSAQKEDPRLAQVRKLAEEALEEAKECGGGSECAASWESVDELYEQVNKLKGGPDTPMGTLKA